MPFKKKYSVLSDSEKGTHTIAVYGVATGLIYSNPEEAEAAIVKVKEEAKKNYNEQRNKRRKEQRQQQQ